MKAKTILLGLCCPAIMLFTSSLAFAGAGANIYACIYMATTPQPSMVANVTAGGSGTHCMNSVGKSTTIKVSSAGLNCSSVGYVEEKASSTKGDTCATDRSYWPLSYTINGRYSGHTQAQIWAGFGSPTGKIELQQSSQKTSVCNTQSLCTTTSTSWNFQTKVEPLYIIFQPQAQ